MSSWRSVRAAGSRLMRRSSASRVFASTFAHLATLERRS
jgi:hypothetical protein